MAHFAKVVNGIVEQIIVAESEFFDTLVDESEIQWIKTSYNIKGGVYYDSKTNHPAEDQSVINEDEGRKRKNYAGIGYTYDSVKNAFIPPKPYNSWVLNKETCLWEAPVPMPQDEENTYIWDEENLSWKAYDITQ